MPTLQEMRACNNGLRLHDVNSQAFAPYGKVVKGYSFAELLDLLEARPIPEEGNVYVASDPDLERLAVKAEMEERHFGGMPVQIGYCNGRNSRMNGLEYHKCSEINVAGDDLVLLLGRIQDIRSNCYEADKVDAFLVPRGTALELYMTTLHFGPCKTTGKGFRCAVVLPRGTNEPLSGPVVAVNEEDKLLFMRNKWLLAHPDRKPLIEKGAHPGIAGPNIRVAYPGSQGGEA